MSRSYGAGDIVTLPKLNASGAVALGASLLVAAGEEQLQGALEKAFARLKKKHAALRKASQARLSPALTEDSPDIRAADRDLDTAWSAAYDWSSGWAKLPGKANAESAAAAQTLLVALFPDGLKFTQLRYKLEWAESQARLDRVSQDHLDKTFDKLGGGPFLKAIKATHKVYGDLLGLTKALPPPGAPPVDVRKPLDDFLAALRKYVICVTADVDEDDAASVARAESLLAPLFAWESAAAEPKAEEAPEPDPGAEPPAPTEPTG